jgi:hypothetical protein
LRKLKQGFEQRKRNRCCKMATTIPYAYLRRTTPDAARLGARKMVKGQIDGWRNLAETSFDQIIGLAA